MRIHERILHVARSPCSLLSWQETSATPPNPFAAPLSAAGADQASVDAVRTKKPESLQCWLLSDLDVVPLTEEEASEVPVPPLDGVHWPSHWSCTDSAPATSSASDAQIRYAARAPLPASEPSPAVAVAQHSDLEPDVYEGALGIAPCPVLLISCDNRIQWLSLSDGPHRAQEGSKCGSVPWTSCGSSTLDGRSIAIHWRRSCKATRTLPLDVQPVCWSLDVVVPCPAAMVRWRSSADAHVTFPTVVLDVFLSSWLSSSMGMAVLDRWSTAGADAPVLVAQDYNEEVVRTLTARNLAASASSGRATVQVMAASWEAMRSADTIPGAPFDLVLMSETLYDTRHYECIAALLKQVVAPGGIALVASKRLYFGVGGGVHEFEAVMERSGGWAITTVASFDDGHNNVRDILCLERRKS